ncbi:MAG: alpha/beta hydrolase, partial [Novosphingobium sp.]
MYEPFANNYVWNLSVNIALMMGAQIGEIVDANEPVIEAAKAGADAGTEAFFNSWCGLADRLVARAEADAASGHK